MLTAAKEGNKTNNTQIKDKTGHLVVSFRL
jgi:hypothetical protein